MKRLLAAATLLAVLLVGAPASQAQDAEVTCAVTWGSTAKAARPLTSPFTHVINARAGRHECFDRLVIDLDNGTAGYSVRYVRRFRQLASGEIIPLAGGARLNIIIRAPAVDDQGHPTYRGVSGQPLPGVDLTGFLTFRSAKYGGTFEGLTQFGLGVRARLPFRVMKLSDRVVIDVAHHW